MRIALSTLFVLVLIAGNLIGQPKPGTIEVTGQSTMSITPDQVVFSLTVSSKEESFSLTLDNLNKQVNQLLDAFKAAGIEDSDIKTLNYNIRENMNYQNGKRTIQGHRASQMIEVKVGFDQNNMKQVYSAIKDSGVEINMGISFRLSDPEKYRPELMTQAVEDAKRKAFTLANASGVELGGIRKISYGVNHRHYPMANVAMDAVRVDAKSETNLSLNPGDLKLTEQVMIIYDISEER